MTEVIDRDSIQINRGGSVHFALTSAPELDEEGGLAAKEFLEGICPLGSEILVDQDDLRSLDGRRVMAVVYCNGLNLNEKLIESEFGYFDSIYCYTSEFANDPWARDGC